MAQFLTDRINLGRFPTIDESTKHASTSHVDPSWFSEIVPFLAGNQRAKILREQVGLLEAQRDDAIKSLNQADAEVQKLLEENKLLRQELETFRRQTASPLPEKSYSVVSLKILQLMFRKDSAFTAEELSQKFEIQVGSAKHQLKKLQDGDLVKIAGSIVWDEHPVAYELTDEGRAYVVEKGLE